MALPYPLLGPLPTGSHEPQVAADAFVLCPIGCFGSLPAEMVSWQQAVYALAHEQARQWLRPSLTERDWFGTWN